MEYQMNLPNNVIVIVRTLNDVDQIDQRSDDTAPTTEIPVSQPIYRSNSSVDFIRDNFLLKDKGLIKERNTKLYENYKLYCNELQIEPFNKDAFYKHLKEVGIETNTGRYGGYKIYNIEFDRLKEIAQHFNNFNDTEKSEIDSLKDEINRLNEIINNFPDELEKQKLELQAKYESELFKLKNDYASSFFRFMEIVNKNVDVDKVEDIDIDNETFETLNEMVGKL
jgi:hydroxymethylpyrimidine pyrophosphatase-like HAD family hydrolase